jgi:hypothetical protein
MSNNSMHIKLADLRSISEKLLAYLEEQGVESFDISVDYYWNIPKEQVYNPYQQPSELDLGQLTDDWYELKKMLDSESRPIAYYFVWLGAILRAIGEHTLL